MKKGKTDKYFVSSTRAFNFDPLRFLIEFTRITSDYKIISGELEKEKLNAGFLIRFKLRKK